jgi:Cu+-exporting ATPase
MLLKEVSKITGCKHCGEPCDEKVNKDFCCFGCEQVYNLLQENDLSQYYTLEETPGFSKKNKSLKDFEYLKEPETVEKLVAFQDKTMTKVSFSLPAIHCSSCLWLLENLHRLNSGIHACKVNFLEKKAIISFNHHSITLHDLVVLLAKIGYEPELNFSLLEKVKDENPDRTLLLKIGVAGFAFGNIMLLSFPEYLGFENAAKLFFLGYLNILLALPVLFYAGWSYLKGAYLDLGQGHLGIHVPLAIGMVTLFSRSVFEILSGAGEGYLDSFSGFVLFLLIGQWFQDYTKKSIAFDRDYKSYFPIAVAVLKDQKWHSRSIDKIQSGDIILLKNNEIIPCDGHLVSGKGKIDYSFVTGEESPQEIELGERIYAGGRQTGSSIKIKVEKSVDQGYLTQLWQESPFKETNASNAEQLLNKISKYFTIVILAIASVTFAVWMFIDPKVAFPSVTAVLIVACPCALALSIPFILGNATRILGKKKFYAKSTGTLENLLDIDSIVFDKTGTITENESMKASYSGEPLNELEKNMIYSLCAQSSHPLSCAISDFLKGESLPISEYTEIPGKGISGVCLNNEIRVGSAEFIFGSDIDKHQNVIVEINRKVLGYFSFQKKLRQNMTSIISSLSHYQLSLLSGDNTSEEERMKQLFPNDASLYFNQSPKDKLKYIQQLQSEGRKVMMIGDGLNDAGALKQSDVGLVVAENNNTFTPACDAIISSQQLPKFVEILNYIKSLRSALYGAFAIAFLYNIVGLCFAVTGNLSPIVAAILMPTSSITIMVYGLLSSRWLSRKLNDVI